MICSNCQNPLPEYADRCPCCGIPVPPEFRKYVEEPEPVVEEFEVPATEVVDEFPTFEEPAAAEEPATAPEFPSFEEPAVVAEEPAAVIEEPVAAVPEFPAFEEPVAVAEEPAAVIEEPVAAAPEFPAFEEPVAVVEEPVAAAPEFPAFEEPAAVVEEPAAAAPEFPAFEEPAAVGEEPVAAAPEFPAFEEPAVAEEPAAVGEEPVAAAPEFPAFEMPAVPFEESATVEEADMTQAEAPAVEIPSFEGFEAEMPTEEQPLGGNNSNTTGGNTTGGSTVGGNTAGAGKGNGNDSRNPLTIIFGIVFSIYFLIQFFKNFFGGLRSFFTSFAGYQYVGFKEVFITLSGLMFIVVGLAALVLLVVSAVMALQYKVGRGKTFLLTFTLGSLVIIAAQFVNIFLTLIYFLTIKAPIRYAGSGKIGMILLAILMVVIQYVIIYASGDRISLGTLDIVKDCMDAVKDFIALLKPAGSDIKVMAGNVADEAKKQKAEYDQKREEETRQQAEAMARTAGTEQRYNSAFPPPAYKGVMLDTTRSLIKYILFLFLTCGFYGLYFTYKLASDINVCCDGDGQHTPGLLEYFVLTFVTCGIYALVWQYNIANRMQANAPRYGLMFTENGTSVLMWTLFGSMLCGIGPYISMNILIKNANTLCRSYNAQAFNN